MKQEFGELMCSQAMARYSDMELEVLHFAELSKEKDFIRGKHVNSVGIEAMSEVQRYELTHPREREMEVIEKRRK